MSSGRSAGLPIFPQDSSDVQMIPMLFEVPVREVWFGGPVVTRRVGRLMANSTGIQWPLTCSAWLIKSWVPVNPALPMQATSLLWSLPSDAIWSIKKMWSLVLS